MLRPIFGVMLISLSILLFGCSETQSNADESNDEMQKVEETQVEKENSNVRQDDTQSENLQPPSEIIKDDRDGIIPERIEIPAIGVDAQIEHLGLLDNGQMAVPDGYENVGWFEPGAKPGEPGNSVIAGHVDDTVNPAVFYDLNKLEEGNEIILTDENGEQMTFVVYKKEVYPLAQSPVNELFGYSHQSLLNLITCSGDYSEEVNSREDRLVVYTKLKEDNR